jgi:hypothetical protein
VALGARVQTLADAMPAVEGKFHAATATTFLGNRGYVRGSGWVAVVPLERGGQGGHFDASLRVAVAVLAELWSDL